MYQENFVKVYAESKLMEYSAKNVTIYRFSENSPTSFRTYLTFDDPLPVLYFPFSRKTLVLIVIKSRINCPGRLYGNL